jgi:acetyltransferase-like isoleucine patch superfamily enzyme
MLWLQGIMLEHKLNFFSIGDIEIESPTYSAALLRLDTFLRIGAFSNLNSGSVIGHTQIGRYCSIGQDCLIGGDKHPSNWISTSRIFYQPEFRDFCKYVHYNLYPGLEVHTGQATVIGNDVFIGPRAIISRGIILGDGCIVMPGSVVTTNVNPYEIVGGNPAKHIKYRFSADEISIFLKSEWWKYNIEDLMEYDASNPLSFVNIIGNLDLKVFKSKFILSNENCKSYTLD